MALNDDVSDEYVAQLLAKDAKDVTQRPSRTGRYDSFLQRPTTNAPKPNTRFLKNIIKETDNHNAALRAKEVQESRARLKRLTREDHVEREPEGGGTHRHSRPQYEDRGSRRPSRRARDDHLRHDNSRSPLRKRRKSRDRYGDDGHKHARRGDNDRPRHRSRDGCEPRNRRHQLSERSTHSSSHTHSQRRHRELSGRHEPELNDTGDGDTWVKHGDRRNSHGKDSSRHATAKRKRRRDPEHSLSSKTSISSDSDPLESFVGPKPPSPKPQIRGRGQGASSAPSSSKIDAHFARTYDPADDAQPDPDVETDDWDLALEALRDRQKWQQRGAERLKAAGFTEDEVSKWTAGSDQRLGGEKDATDVRWKGRGESREWDRGKVMGADGVSTEAEWGRLR